MHCEYVIISQSNEEARKRKRNDRIRSVKAEVSSILLLLVDPNRFEQLQQNDTVITLLNKHRSEKLFSRFILEICLVLIDQGCIHLRVFVIFSQPSLRLLLSLVEYVIVKVKVIIISSKYRTRNG